MIDFRRYDPATHHRRSIRLKGYDYSREGMYFITICAHGRECLFGKIENGIMMTNTFGPIVLDEWFKTAEIRSNIELGEFVVMPNHIHGIIIINAPPASVRAYCNTPHNQTDSGNAGAYCNTPQQADGTDSSNGAYGNTPQQADGTDSSNGAYGNTPLPFRSPAGTIGAIVRGYKSTVTKQINVIRNTPKKPVWQRNYYEHIIRNHHEYKRISDYIINNPKNWNNDKFSQ